MEIRLIGWLRIMSLSRSRGEPYRSAEDWEVALSTDDPLLLRSLGAHYGDASGCLAAKRGLFLDLVREFARRFGGERPLRIARAPGRINLMGRHIDHRGGHVNVVAIDREILVASAPRPDDLLVLANLDPRFEPRDISLPDLRVLRTQADERDAARGDWSHYVRAVVVALEGHFDVRLHGLDLLVTGDIPVGKGLASSSALVMALAELLVAECGLDPPAEELVQVVGDGEKLVGVQGGVGDHAAIKLSMPGFVSHVACLPTVVESRIALPSGVAIVVAHGGETALKSAGARDTFNQRVACSDIALELLRHHWPIACEAKHLRDLTEINLGLRAGAIYEGLEALPAEPSRLDILSLLPRSAHSRVESLFENHSDPGTYDLRGVTLFALGECERSRLFPRRLEAEDLDGIGRLMKTSHDGDRLPGEPSDLDRLRAACPPLHGQSGRYACSTEAIDRLVDIAVSTPGICGAQLAAAGLGGCIMAMAQDWAVDDLLERFRVEFYEPRGLEPTAFAVASVAGSGVIEWTGA